MDETEELEVPIGTVLAGKYRVDRILGAGGMGVVVAAHHIQLDQQVAIKMLLPSMLKHREAVERFTREARAAVKIKSEHVARVSDVGLLETGAPYMVMEYLEGEDLGHWVSERGPLAVEQAVEFLLQAAEAIAEAHALGIVHRDIKPANLFCVRRADGLLSVKVLDFGISKLTNAPMDLGMTKTQTVMGSPHYMAPEQVLSAKNADAQSDIWSLGAVLFELLSGRVPYEAETFPELVLKVSGTDAPSVASLRLEVSDELADVVACCLERDREQRFKNLAELAVALVPFGPPRRAEASAERVIRVLESGTAPLSRGALISGLPALPVASRRTRLTATTKPGPMSPGTNRTVATFSQTAGEGRTKSRKYAGFVAVGVLLLGAGAWWLLYGSKAAADATATAPPGVDANGSDQPRSAAGGPDARPEAVAADRAKADPGVAHSGVAHSGSADSGSADSGTVGESVGQAKPPEPEAKSPAPEPTTAAVSGASTKKPPSTQRQSGSSPSGSRQAGSAHPTTTQPTKPSGTAPAGASGDPNAAFGGRL